MRRSVAIVIVMVCFVLLGTASVMAGLFQRRLAIAQEDIAVLDFADPQEEYVRLEHDLHRFPWLSAGVMKEINFRRAELQYWQHDYGDLLEVARTSTESTDAAAQADPEVRLIAANALFRTAQQGPQDRPTLLRNLDNTIRAYTEALRAGAQSPDAAFNYELAIRLRAEVSGGKRKTIANPRTDDTKTDPNMHGDPGEPPKDMKVEQFQIRIPMDPRDIKNSQEQAAGTGQQRRRRG